MDLAVHNGLGNCSMNDADPETHIFIEQHNPRDIPNNSLTVKSFRAQGIPARSKNRRMNEGYKFFITFLFVSILTC